MLRRYLALTFALASLALLVAWWAAPGSEPREAPAVLALQRDESPATPPLVELAEQRREAPLEGAPESSPPLGTDILLTGRCVDAQAQPLPDVAFQLRRWHPRADRRENQVLAPIDVRSDTEGRFAIAVPHVATLTLWLRLLDPRYAEQQWRWQSLEPGAREDLGDIVVKLGATLRGRLFDFAGAPIREHWRVSMNRIEVEQPGNWVPEALAQTGAQASERFELVGLSAGKWSVAARYPSFEFATSEVVLTAGAVHEIELRQSGTRNPWREIVVWPDQPHLMPEPDPAHVKLIDASGTTRCTTRKPNSSELRFSDVEPGPYRILIDDPRYEPWSHEGVEPSPVVLEPELRGNSAIELLVVDRATQQPIPSYAFELVSHDRSTGDNGDLTKPRKQRPHPEGRCSVTGVVAGDFRFVLHAEGWPARLVEVKGLLPGETRAERIELDRGVTLTGMVRRAGSAQPAAGAEVVLLRPALVGDGPDSFLLRLNWRGGNEDHLRKEVANTKSALDGSFRLEGVQPGRWILLAVLLAPGEKLPSTTRLCRTCALLESLVVEVDRAPEPVLIELPATGTIQGRAALPENARRKGIALQLFRVIESQVPLITPDVAEANWDAQRVGTQFLEAGGEYRFENLAAGTYRLAATFSSASNEPSALEERVQARRVARNVKELLLAEGATLHCDLDLALLAPAEVHAQLTVEGGEPGSLSLILQATREGERSIPFDLQSQQAPFDAQGVALHSAVLPGRKAVVAVGGGGSWCHIFERDLDVSGGSRHTLRANLVLHTGEVEVTDAEGRILAEQRILVRPTEHDTVFYARGAWPSLDDRGRVRLALPAGRYRLETERRGQDPVSAAELVWPAGELVQLKLAATR